MKHFGFEAHLEVFFLYARACGRLMFAFVVCLAAVNVSLAKSAPLKKTVASNPDLDSAKSTDRLEALESNKNRRDRFSSQKLKSKLKSEKNPLVRHRLNQALASADSSDALTALIESLQTDTDPMVRQGAAQSLSQYAKSPVVARALADSLSKETIPAVRYAAALSLTLSDSPEALTALEKAASDADVNIRKQVAYGLHRNTNKNAQRILKKLKGDKDPAVRDVARKEEL